MSGTGRFGKATVKEKILTAFFNFFDRASFNIIAVICILLSLFSLLVFAYPTISEHVTYDSEQIFVDYNRGWLNTDIDSFEIPKSDKQEIKIYKLIQAVKTGEKITLTISDLSGELLEIRYKDEVVYKKAPAPIAFRIIFSIFGAFPLLGISIFCLIETNIPNSRRRSDKLQKKIPFKTRK